MWRFKLSLFFVLILPGYSCENQVKSVEELRDQFKNHELNLIVFFIEDCPVCFNVAPKIQQLIEQNPEINTYWVYSTPLPDSEKLTRFLDDYHIQESVYFDTDLGIAKFFGATVTPEVFLIDRHGHIVYRGLVDDYFFEFGKHKNEAQRNFLEDAVEAFKNSKIIANSKTEPVGCLIEYTGKNEL